ncbi:MAG: 50S ribosomal protein L11 methyltransferase [Dysgonamonadaceae bacterium]|jgi:ribosomal protein L11 methyltransferase|nr:50S ribosomal protein L11 methyltransferase [Dysgonamonadaceae bacterium]
MRYFELNISIAPDTAENRDILTALLTEIGFEGFVEADQTIVAYIPEKDYSEAALSDMIKRFPVKEAEMTHSIVPVEDRNWNSVWEQYFFRPITVGDQCYIHSSFHEQKPGFQYDIVIDPKMAFGTGHHETTGLMLSFLLEADVKDKSFLDMGCGTALLAILARMKGAFPVVAIDNDPNAYRNALENIKLNNTEDIQVLLGDAHAVQNRFSMIFANITRNILLEDVPLYAAAMLPDAQLYVSGFYADDTDRIVKTFGQYGLQLTDSKEQNKWVALRFIR